MTRDEFKDWVRRMRQTSPTPAPPTAIETSDAPERPPGAGWYRVGRQWVRDRLPPDVEATIAAGRGTMLDRVQREFENFRREMGF